MLSRSSSCQFHLLLVFMYPNCQVRLLCAFAVCVLYCCFIAFRLHYSCYQSLATTDHDSMSITVWSNCHVGLNKFSGGFATASDKDYTTWSSFHLYFGRIMSIGVPQTSKRSMNSNMLKGLDNQVHTSTLKVSLTKKCFPSWGVEGVTWDIWTGCDKR